MADASVGKWVRELNEVGLIRLYIDSDRVYGFFVTWDKYQHRRARNSKYPAPTDANICEQTPADVNGCEQIHPRNRGSEESRNRGSRRGTGGGKKTPWPDDFDLTDDLARYATRQGLDAAYQWGKFKAHAQRDEVKHVNWVRAWEYWVRNAWEIEGRRRG